MLILSKEAFLKWDIHIHFPEGAVPKDGPSAGVTITMALLSQLLDIPNHQDIAMTGEVNLRGQITIIGGLKEKLLAAVRYGMRKVLIPMENEKDLEDIPAEIKKVLTIIPIQTIEEAATSESRWSQVARRRYALSAVMGLTQWD